MRDKALTPLVLLALFAGIYAAVIATMAYFNGPQGVCVMHSLNFADTSVIAAVEAPQRHDGVLTCEVGQFVPVTSR